jgi:hypothetical protein
MPAKNRRPAGFYFYRPMAEKPYRKKDPRQTHKRITSVEHGSSGLVAGLLYTWSKESTKEKVKTAGEYVRG